VNGANSSKGVSASPTRTCRGPKWVGGGGFGKKALDEAVGVELRSRVLSLVSFLRLAWRRSQEFRARLATFSGLGQLSTLEL
jgi:hypothetical protein